MLRRTYRPRFSFTVTRPSVGFSTLRPAIYEILPKKKVINRILFDLDSRHSYSQLYRAYEIIYNKLDSEEEPAIPKYISASDLMVMKKVLETIRLKSHTTNRNLLDLENELVEKAAEFGNNDAVSLLAFEAIVSEDSSPDDKVYAKKLVKGLLKINHPLTLKLSADLCLKSNKAEQAQDFYKRFLKTENDTYVASEVYKSLGLLSFQKPDLVNSRLYFEQSIKTGPIDKVAESHYYLGQLNATSDPEKARHHFEAAASQGLKESFQHLGFLELNYFNDLPKAREWFKLGYELYDVTCMIGLFDCHVKESQWRNSFEIYRLLEKLLNDSDDKEKKLVWDHFSSSRAISIESMNVKYSPINQPISKMVENELQSSDSRMTPDQSRWNL